MTYIQNENERRISLQPRRVLVVDDDEINLEILLECLCRRGDKVQAVDNGIKAIEILLADPNIYDIVLLDRMMPKMSGIEVFQYMQDHPRLQYIPVVMQTAAATLGDIESGLAAGILYYLSKPYDRRSLFSIMSTAVSDAENYRELRDLATRPQQVVTQDIYGFQTLKEARSLAIQLAHSSPCPQKAVIGLYELLSNAVEHGILGLDYTEKTRLLEQGLWLDEINNISRTLDRSRQASVRVSQNAGSVCYLIQDDGPGFCFEDYLTMSPQRATDNHGRGIAVAKRYCFDQLQYQGCGNSVLAITEVP